jgi:hypothetical protein
MHEPNPAVDLELDSILGFLRAIGLKVQACALEGDTFLPGIEVREGGLLYDLQRLAWPADLLHEAGHLAVMPAALRPGLSGDLHDCSTVPHAGEAEAIAWAYAASLAIGLNARSLFHAGGYQGRGESLAFTFEAGCYPGAAGLVAAGLALEPAQARTNGQLPYPVLRQWLRD